MSEIYKLVLKAQQVSTCGAVAGSIGKNVDKIARDIIYGNGYEENFGHGLGHSVGLEIHENPRFSINDENVIQNNMVITVEPGIYIEGFGGVRIEDIIIINDTSPIILTKSPKEIIVI
jgi:Xaa-Pro aminopeptidase